MSASVVRAANGARLLDVKLGFRAVFIPHSGFAKPERKRPKIDGAMLDLFAEHLANGVPPGRAAYIAGGPEISSYRFLKALRKQLGGQAR